jgi:soluble lytic murein transglycosylase-like protein
MANHPSASQWQKIFKSPAAMATELSTRSDFDLDSWRENKKIARLLFRSEILVKANLGDWTKLGVMELSDAVSKEYALVSKNLSAFVYLTRLQFLAGLHHNSISLTTSMMKIDPDFWKTWPEQLLIYFPQPYSEVFGQYAQKLAMDEELLYAVSRQETSFRARVTSNAGAVGLMQLLPVTAAKFAREAGQRVDRIEQDLLEVDFNIAVGGTYLKYLDSYYRGFLPGVFGGYNAGEMAINYWVSRRHHADPLVWVELVPFGETKGYIKNVWRNYFVYKFLGQRSSKDATH